jgi:hypothetical protein
LNGGLNQRPVQLRLGDERGCELHFYVWTQLLLVGVE